MPQNNVVDPDFWLSNLEREGWEREYFAGKKKEDGNGIYIRVLRGFDCASPIVEFSKKQKQQV